MRFEIWIGSSELDEHQQVDLFFLISPNWSIIIIN